MSLMPVFSPIPNLELLGTWVSPDNTTAPAWDFTSISFDEGDLLVAISVYGVGDTPAGPAGFTALEELTGASTNIGIYSKVATGSETTFSNSVASSNVATAVLRNAWPGASDSLENSDDPPAIANAGGDVVFALYARDKDEPTASAPSGYTLAGAEFASAADSFIALAYKQDASANENPGSFGSFSGADRSVATFSITAG
ncbi:hypothetical protein PVV74_17325 [Roseovarius sp. SK2]|uniref:hypothetical protein n=1 Tax=Roseovarius TaxID=74030 RepID=UPI00237AFEA1|nr:hypothetical protein [Roseovarius sp. SK2]MDD9727225.1 hypothetical protein [Roseovarius sp. SK2]